MIFDTKEILHLPFKKKKFTLKDMYRCKYPFMINNHGEFS